MNINPYIVPGVTTMAILGIVFLVFIFWVRRPGRINDIAEREMHDL